MRYRIVVSRVTGRIVRWQPSLGALALMAFIMWRTGASADNDRTFATIFLAAGLAPILIDPAAVTVASSPTPLRERFAYRLVWTLPALVCWMATQWIFVVDPHRMLPPRWVWLELVTSMAIVLTAEQATARATRATGLAGVAALLCCVALVSAASRHIAILPIKEHELRVASIGAVATAACWIACRDPALRLNRGRRSPRQIANRQWSSEDTCKNAQVGSWPRSPRS